jgi:hypothetical protein
MLTIVTKKVIMHEIVECQDRKFVTEIHAENVRETGIDCRQSANRQSATCNRLRQHFIEIKLDISTEEGLLFLLDTGAEVSVVKSQKLIGSTRFDPQRKIKLKSVDGSVVETNGLIEAKVEEGSLRIPISLQLVNKQLDIEGDGILGKDFLLKTRAQICYKQKRVNFKWQNSRSEKLLKATKKQKKEMRK